MTPKPSIKHRLEAVNTRIDRALNQALRNRSGLTMIAVSKGQPLSVVQEVYSLGVRDFGENQIQEGTPKVKTSPKDIVWHFIGHLQKNKVRKAVTHFQYIHGVDSLTLLQRIHDTAAEERLCPKIFLQVNYALDPDKYGLHPEAVAPVLEAALSLASVSCIGLMGIPPVTAATEEEEAYFKGMVSLRDELLAKFPDWPGKLSMGMSSDFEAAIRAGSNFIRIGRALMGERS